jgi:hypothetical protein
MGQFWTFFAFPLNLLLAILWFGGWGWLWKNRPASKCVRFMLSPSATVSALVLLLCGGLWIGLSGSRDFVQTVPFVAVLLYVQTVVFLITLRGWRRSDGVIRWRFLLIHIGLLMAVGAGFWGAPDSSEMRLSLSKGDVAQKAYLMDGRVAALGYDLSLEDYDVETSSEGKPSYYEARVSVDGGECVKITVNHPYSVRMGEDIYLSSVSEAGCVLQIVREPWRYFALAGILMLLAGAFMLFIKGPRR